MAIINSPTSFKLIYPFIERTSEALNQARDYPTPENFSKYAEECDLFTTQLAVLYKAGVSSDLDIQLGGDRILESLEDPEEYSELERKIDKIWLEKLIKNLNYYGLKEKAERMQEVLNQF